MHHALPRLPFRLHAASKLFFDISFRNIFFFFVIKSIALFSYWALAPCEFISLIKLYIHLAYTMMFPRLISIKPYNIFKVLYLHRIILNLHHATTQNT